MTLTSGGLHCVAQSSMAVVTLKSNVREGKMPCDRAQMEMFSYWGKVNGKRREGREKTGLWGREQQKRRETERDTKREGGRDRQRWGMGRAPLKGNQ